MAVDLRRVVIRRAAACLVLLAAISSACGGTKGVVPPGAREADRFLFEAGTASLNDKKWLRAREYFRTIVDSYPQSPYRPDAKLGVGDTYLGDGTAESLTLAVNAFREFLTFYPTNRRADYAQYKLGLAHHKRMLAPERDQTQTREAIQELETFLERYPNSSLLPEVTSKLREARDRLSESEYRVGLFYFRSRWYPGAIERFKGILKSDPEYTNRDAVYYYLAESLVRTEKKAEALPYYERLLQEFEQSEYLEEVRKRIAELKVESL